MDKSRELEIDIYWRDWRSLCAVKFLRLDEFVDDHRHGMALELEPQGLLFAEVCFSLTIFLTAILHRGLRNDFFFMSHLLFPFSFWTFISIFSLDFYFPFLFGHFFQFLRFVFNSFSILFQFFGLFRWGLTSKYINRFCKYYLVDCFHSYLHIFIVS